MAKITGMENVQNIPSKVLLLYGAVEQLIMEGADIRDISVSTITDKAGIGKGTAYDYFESKEEILTCAVLYYMRKAVEELRDGLSGIENFQDRVHYLTEQIDKNSFKQQYLIKYVHIMTDTSGLGRMVQDKLRTEDSNQYCPLSVYREIIVRAQKRGEIKRDLPVDYMVFVLFSRIMSYMMCVGEERMVSLEAEKIRSFVCNGILDELCEKKV